MGSSSFIFKVEKEIFETNLKWHHQKRDPQFSIFHVPTLFSCNYTFSPCLHFQRETRIFQVSPQCFPTWRWVRSQRGEMGCAVTTTGWSELLGAPNTWLDPDPCIVVSLAFWGARMGAKISPIKTFIRSFGDEIPSLVKRHGKFFVGWFFVLFFTLNFFTRFQFAHPVSSISISLPIGSI